MGCAIIFSVITAGCAWGAFAADDSDTRGLWIIAAEFFAYVTYRRVKWLASEDDSQSASPANTPGQDPDAPS
jgi:hypothetical protein